MRSALILLAGLAATGFAAPSDNHVLHEKRDDLSSPIKWTKRQAADAQQNVGVKIALKQQNLDKAMDLILEVSDPASPKYGKHYKSEEVIDLFAPRKEAVDAVTSWLVKSGVPANDIVLSRSRGWITFKSKVDTLQSLVKADYHIYNNVHTRDEHIGTDEYHLPADVASFVDFILPGTSPQIIKKRDSPRTSSSLTREPFVPLSKAQDADLKSKINGTHACDKYITPQCIAAIYNIPPGTSAIENNALGIFESLDDVYAQEDLDSFYKNYAPKIPAGTGPTLNLINGATAPYLPEDSGGESSLDFQIAIPIVYPQSTTLFQVRTKQDTFLALLDAIDESFCKIDPDRNKTSNEMCNVFQPTNVISISYGGLEYGNSVKEMSRECNEYMKLGLVGVTIVMSSGDSGVAGFYGTCLGPRHNIFVPTDASTCPFVTSVGSTTLPKGGKIGTTREVATTSFSSSGGFSNLFPTPPWQKNAVSNYLLRHNPNYFSYNISGTTQAPNDTIGIYNRGGRAYPDISALGDNGVVVSNGTTYLSGGTSMSAPIVAAIITRINEERMKLGKGPLGFLNPALYKAYDDHMKHPSWNPQLFNDVVTGDQSRGGSYGARYPSACGNNGFSAVEGWDPVTGLGTPKYDAMAKYFIKL